AKHTTTASSRQALCDVSVMPSDGTSSRVGYIRPRYPHVHRPACCVHCDPQMLQGLPVLQAVKPLQTPAPLQKSPVVQRLWSLQGLFTGSNWQVELQQSPFTELPSSHCSPGSTCPLPHPVPSAS